MQFKKIKIQDIKSTACFCWSFNNNYEDLKQSIQNFGMINPLIYSHQFGLIDGFMRLKIAQELKMDSIWIHEIDDVKNDLAQNFILGLDINTKSKTFNVIEKAIILKQAVKLLNEKQLKQVLEKIGLKPHFEIKKLTSLLKLPLEIQNFAVSNQIHSNCLEKFFYFDEKVQLEIFNIIKKYPINQNKLLDILESLNEISKRDEKEILSLLNELTQKYHQSHLENLEKIRMELHHMRFPLFLKKKKDFDSFLKAQKIPSQFQILVSDYFEKDEITLTTKISKLEDVQKTKDLLSQKFWDQLLDKI